MDFAQQLKSSVDIVDIIGERVRLKRVGSGPRYMGLCPFHTEKTPSFSVHQTLQIYKCFGCGAGGDVFRFLMELESLTFFEAMKMLAERCGIPMPSRSEHADSETRLREALLQMNELAWAAFRRQLLGPQGEQARAYLASRGVGMDLVEEFGLGLAIGGSQLAQLLEKEGFSLQQREHSGLVVKRESGGFYDRFRNRLIFPIHNETGKVVGFAGRALAAGDEPKYLNSPETVLYKKSQLLYNLHRAKESARQRRRFVLVEGYMDVIGLWAAGIREAVASCGTALTPGQVKLMKRFADQVIVNFDPDAGGVRGAEKSIDVLVEEQVRIRVLELEEDLDPDEFIKQYGPNLYLQKLEGAPNYYFWLADKARQRFDCRTAEGRTMALEALLPAVQRIPDKIERAGVANDLAAFLGVDAGLVLDRFKKAALGRRETRGKLEAAPLRPLERILLSSLLLYPELREEIIPQLRQTGGWRALRSHAVIEALAALWESEPEFGYADLEARLEENDRSLLSSLVFADEMQETNNIESARLNARRCVEVLRRGELQSQLSLLRQRIKAAQQTGDLDLAMQLVEELDRKKRQEQFLRGAGSGEWQ